MKIAALLASSLVWGLLTAAAPQDHERAAQAAFAAARAATPTPLRLDREHQEWRLDRQSEGADPGDTDERWADRWRAAAARDSKARSLAVALDSLPGRCVDIGLDNCLSTMGGYLNIRGEPLMWQLQQGSTDEDGVSGGYVLMTGSDRLRPEAWSHDGAWYDTPRAFWIGERAYVAVPGFMAGAGAYNADALYRFTPGADHPLTEIDNESWRDIDLPALLPTGLEIWKGVSFSYDGMTARTALWRPSDGNCCPSGGEATLEFEIRGDRLVLTRLVKDDAP